MDFAQQNLSFPRSSFAAPPLRRTGTLAHRSLGEGGKREPGGLAAKVVTHVANTAPRMRAHQSCRSFTFKLLDYRFRAGLSGECIRGVAARSKRIGNSCFSVHADSVLWVGGRMVHAEARPAFAEAPAGLEIHVVRRSLGVGGRRGRRVIHNEAVRNGEEEIARACARNKNLIVSLPHCRFLHSAPPRLRVPISQRNIRQRLRCVVAPRMHKRDGGTFPQAALRLRRDDNIFCHDAQLRRP
jgi:hypothetical protein